MRRRFTMRRHAPLVSARPVSNDTGLLFHLQSAGSTCFVTSRSCAPVNIRTVTGFCADDMVQSLVSELVSACAVLATHCIPLQIISSMIDTLKTSCGSNVYILHVITPLDTPYGMTAVCACADYYTLWCKFPMMYKNYESFFGS